MMPLLTPRPNKPNLRIHLRPISRITLAVLLSAFIPQLHISLHAQSLPPSALVEGVVGHPQQYNLSCEARSATDLAAFWGVLFTEDEFLQRLPRSDNPHRGFLGDVNMPPGSMPPLGYGVYAGPVAATLRSFGLHARARFGWSLEELKAELAAGRPAIIWATYDMRLPGTTTWTSSDGETSIVVQWEHTFIAIGYDENNVYLIDAYDGAVKSFPYEVFLPAWEQLGSMAVTAKGRLSPSQRVVTNLGREGHPRLIGERPAGVNGRAVRNEGLSRHKPPLQ
ncbi:MAG: C39 family peptidase [Anaerolineae bacterium]|nr:C39 family peptidase [Anaerolineae bacterium]